MNSNSKSAPVAAPFAAALAAALAAHRAGGVAADAHAESARATFVILRDKIMSQRALAAEYARTFALAVVGATEVEVKALDALAYTSASGVAAHGLAGGFLLLPGLPDGADSRTVQHTVRVLAADCGMARAWSILAAGTEYRATLAALREAAKAAKAKKEAKKAPADAPAESAESAPAESAPVAESDAPDATATLLAALQTAADALAAGADWSDEARALLAALTLAAPAPVAA